MELRAALAGIEGEGLTEEAECIRQAITSLQLESLHGDWPDCGEGGQVRQDGTQRTPAEVAARQVLKVLSEAVGALRHVGLAQCGSVSILRDYADSLGAMAFFVSLYDWMSAGATIDDLDLFRASCLNVAGAMFAALDALKAGENASG